MDKLCLGVHLSGMLMPWWAKDDGPLDPMGLEILEILGLEHLFCKPKYF